MAEGDQPLKFSDFFDAKDVSALNKFKKGLKEVADEYEKDIGRITKENKELKDSMEANRKEAKKLRDELKKNTTVSEKRRKTIEETNESSQKLLKTQEEQEKQLIDNNKQIVSLEGNLKDVNKATKSLNKTEKDALKIAKDEDKIRKILNKENEQAVRTRLKLQKATAEQRRELKQLLVIEDKLAGAEEKLLAKTELLRIERKKLNNVTDATGDKLKAINAQIDENNEKLIENSDKLKRNKVQIGGYKDAIGEALSETDVFNGALGDLGELGEKVVSTLRNMAISLKAQEQAQKSANQATTKGAKAFRVLDKAAKATVILAIIGALVALGKAFAASRKAQREFLIVSAQVGNTLKIVGQILFKAGKQIGEAFTDAFDSIRVAGLKLKLEFLEIKNALTFGRASEEIKKVNDRIKELGDQDLSQIGINLANIFSIPFLAVKEIVKASKGSGKVINDTNILLREALELQDRLIDLEAVRSRQLVIITGELEKQQAIAGDSTRSFDEQEIAARKVLVIQRERIDLELKTANERLDVAAKLIRNDLKAAGISDRISEADIRSLDILKDKLIADEVQIENLEQLRDASIELATIEAQRAVQAIESSRIIGEINRDRFEQELDFALDVFDRQKSVNERIIADDTRTFEERFKLLEKTKRLNESSFESQIKLTKDFIQTTLDERLKLAKEEGILDRDELKRLENQISRAKELDIVKLTTLENEKDVRKLLISQGVADEITQNRIREIIIERKAALQDLAEAERDLLREFAEFSKTLDRDLKRIEEAFKSEALQIDLQQLERLIQLRKELEALESLPVGEERIRRQREILDQITAIEQEAADERNDIVLRELELKKATISQELSEITGATAKELMLREELAAQLIDIEAEITKNKIANEKEKVDAVGKAIEEEQKLREDNQKKLGKVLGDITKQGITLINTLFDAQKQRNEDDLTELQILKEHEIVLAGDNVERKIEIEQEFFKQEQEIREKQRKTIRRQAIFNKAIAVTDIAISTAQAIAKTLALGGPFAIPLAIAIGALGAIQLATAIASPIPRFEKGTMNAPKGLAMTDERGPELHTDKRGRIKDMGSNRPQLKFLASGDIIRPAGETSAIMDMLGGKINNSFSISAMDGAVKASNDLRPMIISTSSGLSKQDHREVMNQTLAKQIQHITVQDEKGHNIYLKRKNSRVKQQQRIINA